MIQNPMLVTRSQFLYLTRLRSLLVTQPLTWADDVFTPFLKNLRVGGKIFEENFILTVWNIFLQILFQTYIVNVRRLHSTTKNDNAGGIRVKK
jgi:hypothetical protein